MVKKMGYRIWSAIQTLFLFLIGWIYLDTSLNSLWIAGWLDGLGTTWFNSISAVAWLIIAVALIHLLKSILIVVRKD